VSLHVLALCPAGADGKLVLAFAKTQPGKFSQHCWLGTKGQR